MRLFIAEKPSLAQAIAHGLGAGKKNDGYIECGNDVVTWCFGHILQQLNPDEYSDRYKSWVMDDLPIIPDPWKLKVTPSCAKQYKIIKGLIAKADEIINAGDPDREGQLLIDEVLNYVGGVFGKKSVRRILLNALDDKSVIQALHDLRDNNDFTGLRDSALARSRADWLVGMNLSRAYSIKAQEAGYDSVSVGRVQTPTMALVVRREEEITHFKPVTHYQLAVSWQHSNGVLPTIWQFKDDMVGLDSEGRLLDRSMADALLTKLKAVAGMSPGKIKKVEQKEKQEQQKLPYSLSALQIDAGRKFGLTPQQVLDTMQDLYEKKLTTYPRSDCDYLPTNQLADAGSVLANLKTIPQLNDFVSSADLSICSRAWNDKKISAHHAIIPTTVAADFTSLSDIEQKLYYLVARAYIAQFYPVHKYLATKIWVACVNEDFTATGKTIIENGWKALYQSDKSADKKEDDDEETDKTLPAVQEGDEVLFDSGKILEKITKPPTRFNPSTLLKAMKEIYKYVKDPALKDQLKECSGIGTEATRAGIIEKLQEKQFLQIEKKYFIPSEKAYMMVKVLPEDITYPDTTAMWEKGLEAVSHGATKLNVFFDSQVSAVRQIIAKAKESSIAVSKDTIACPKCGKPMKRRKGKNGFFWGCSGYPACKSTAPDKKGKPDFTAAAHGSGSGLTASCPKCGKQLRQIKGQYGTFWSCEDRENCGAKFSDCKNKPVIIKCPTCGKGYLTKKKGKKGAFWSCNRYPDCKVIFQDKNGMPDMK